MGRRLNAARAYLGLGSSQSSTSGSSGTGARSGGSSAGGWHSYDPAAAQRQPREVHPAPAVTDRFGRRVPNADPYNQPGADTTRNFGRPYVAEDGGVR